MGYNSIVFQGIVLDVGRVLCPSNTLPIKFQVNSIWKIISANKVICQWRAVRKAMVFCRSKDHSLSQDPSLRSPFMKVASGISLNSCSENLKDPGPRGETAGERKKKLCLGTT